MPIALGELCKESKVSIINIVRQKDAALSLAAGSLIGIFLIPTGQNVGFDKLIPLFPISTLVALPILSFIGIYIANFIGKRIPFLWQVAKFALVGFVNTAIDFGILNFLIIFTQITSGYLIFFLNAISFGTALVNSYFWNREWVFGSKKKGSFGIFLAVTLLGLAINSGIVYLFTTFVPRIIVPSDELWANVAKVLATGVSMVWNFVGYKLVVFKKR